MSDAAIVSANETHMSLCSIAQTAFEMTKVAYLDCSLRNGGRRHDFA